MAGIARSGLTSTGLGTPGQDCHHLRPKQRCRAAGRSADQTVGISPAHLLNLREESLRICLSLFRIAWDYLQFHPCGWWLSVDQRNLGILLVFVRSIGLLVRVNFERGDKGSRIGIELNPGHV